MKKIIASVIISVMTTLTFTAYANNESHTQAIGLNYNVTISGNINSGKANKVVDLYVVKPDTVIPAGVAPVFDNAKTVHIDQTITKANGAYDFKFVVNPNLPSGTYPYSVVSHDGTIESGSFEYINLAWRSEFIDAINTATSEENLKAIAQPIIQKAGITNPLFQYVGINGIYKGLYAEIQKQPFDKNKPEEFLSKFDELIAVAACNLSVSALIKDGKLQYIDILGSQSTSPADEFISLYNNNLNSTGVTKVNLSMMGKGFANAAEAQKKFKESVIFNLICNNSAIGFGHVEGVLDKYADDIGLNTSKYTSTNKSKINRYLVQNPAYDIATLQKNFNAAAASESGGGSGGGGGGSSSTGIRPITEVQPLLNESNANTARGVFSDIKDAAWAETAITALAGLGIVNGNENSEFKPNNLVKREELLKMIVEMLKLSDGSDYSTDFADVPSDAWFSRYVSIGVKNGIVNGMGAGSFGVGNNISRQDIATICYRALKNKGVLIDENLDGVRVADEDQISDYAVKPIKVLKKLSIISGFEDGSYRPQNETTRAEAAMIIYNIYKKLGNGGI